MSIVKFSEVAHRAYTREDRFNTEKIYYVGGEHIDSCELYVTKMGVIKGSTIGPMFYCGFTAGQILFVTRNPHLKKCSIADFDGICSEKTFVIETKDESILTQEYLAIIMQSDDFWNYCEENKSGGVNYFLNWSTLADYEFELPPIKQQLEIAQKVMSAYRLKQSYKKLLDATREMVKSQFIEMFGNPQINDKSFKTTKFINVVTLQRGYDLPVNKRDNSGDIPVYGSNGLLGFHNQAKIDQGVITGRSGTLGEVYMCDTPFWPLNTTLFSIDTHGNNLIYLQYLLIFYDLRRFASGAGVPTLNRNEFHDNEMISVPIELQNEFAEFVKLIDKSKFVCHSKNFLCDIFTFSSSTIAYPSVVSIFVCPKRC